MARPKEAELSTAFREKEAQERERLEARLARHLQEDMGRLFDEGTHADLTFVLPGTTVSAHSAIIKQRAPLLYNRYVRGANPDAITMETEDASTVQTFIRSLYTEDTVRQSLWEQDDHTTRMDDHTTCMDDNMAPTTDTPMDTNGNGHPPDTEVSTTDPPNGSNTMSPDHIGTENHVSNGVPAVQGCCPLGTDLLTMYRNKTDADVIITAQATQFPAHRAVLCARSSYFSAMLSGGWRESTAQEVVLERVSAGVVEQALLFMYGGPAQLSPTCDLGELVMVSDMYGISGIKEIAAFILKRDYCHFFHKPCTGCLVGVCETLPITFNFGLEDLHERCLRWNNKHFVRLWPTKPFALLPQEVLDKCCTHLINDISRVTVLDMLFDIDRLNGTMPQVRWADPVVTLTTRLMDACINHLGNHLANVVSTEKFLSLGKTMALGIDMLLEVMRRGVASMPVKCAVQTYLQCRKLVEHTETEDCDWTENFCSLVRALYAACEQFMHHNVHLVVGTDDWTRLSATDQAAIKEGGCFVVPEEAKKPAFKRPPRSTGALRPTMLAQPFQQGARGGGRGRGSTKTPSPKTPSPAAGGGSGGRTPQTPSGKKGGGVPGQTRLTPTTPGTKTKTLTKTKSPQTASPRVGNLDGVANSGAEGGGGPEAMEAGTAGSGTAVEEGATGGGGPAVGDGGGPPEVAEGAQGGACCAELLPQEPSGGQAAQRPPPPPPPAPQGGKLPVGGAHGKATGGSKRSDAATRQARPGSAGGSTKQVPAAKTGLPTRKIKSASGPTAITKPKSAPAASNGKDNKPATKRPASTRQPPSSAKTKNDKTAENQKNTESGGTKSEASRTRMRPPSAQIPKTKPKTLQDKNKESDRSRTSSGSSQVSSPRSATSASPRSASSTSKSASSGLKMPLVKNKTPPRKTSAQSCKENDAVYAKCTSMRIAAMKERKPSDADLDIETESVVSTSSHVAVQGSRCPSIMDLDLSPSDLPLGSRSATNGSPRPGSSGSPRTGSSASKLPLVKNKNPQPRKTSAQSCRENNAVYAKCTSMRIAAMRGRKPIDADLDIDTESIVSTSSHVAVQGSRCPSIMDLDLSPSESQDCNGTSRPSLGNGTDSLDGSVGEHYLDVPLCPPQEHSDVIVPVFNAIFSLPDATKER